jgi:hypothetical protein
MTPSLPLLRSPGRVSRGWESGDVATVTAEAPVGLTFDEVRRLHAAALHRLCVLTLGHPGAAEAATGHVLDVAAAAHAVEPPAPGTALRWLCGIACDVLGDGPPPRRGRRAPGAVATGWGLDVDAALVRAATLGMRERLAAGLRCAAGLDYAEIGEILGIRADAARAACAKAVRCVLPRRGRRR